MLREMPVSSFAGWAEFAAREPFGPAAFDARIGYILATLVSAITGEPTKPADYTPRWTEQARQEPKRQDWRAIRAVVREWKQCQPSAKSK